MPVLRKRGAVVRTVLPEHRDLPKEDQMILEVVVPTRAQLQEFSRITMPAIGTNQEFEATMRGYRYIFGQCLKSVENCTIEDGEAFALERDANGWLTEECLEQIYDFCGKIIRVIQESGVVQPHDQKNC